MQILDQPGAPVPATTQLELMRLAILANLPNHRESPRQSPTQLAGSGRDDH
jgi:hypothetical protein